MCQSQQRHLHAPAIKSHLATTSNGIVQHGIFFMWELACIVLIDEAIRLKAGDCIGKSWGPLVFELFIVCGFDSRGHRDTCFLINRAGFSWPNVMALFSEDLTERHIALAKMAMPRLDMELKPAGIDVAPSEICQEACMSRNLLLEHNGGTPQTALIGVEPRGWAARSKQ
eukprot:2723825-Pyramimonas_sp.AAC.1